MSQNTMGQGQLKGLGFYLDRHTVVRMDNEAVAARRGFLAPYVYAELDVIDIAAGSVVATAPIRSSVAMTSDNPDGAGDAWDVLTTAQKVETLRQSIRDGLVEQLPKVAGAFGAKPAATDAGLEAGTRVRP
ncbi:hypothetical protein ACQ859_23865 [Roseateles chitinivorans]|uniref:hypothetical protein n=1 Tax=Roseateles chitinivorans TaxID=2917965 RepID=UPI003D67EBEA